MFSNLIQALIYQILLSHLYLHRNNKKITYLAWCKQVNVLCFGETTFDRCEDDRCESSSTLVAVAQGTDGHKRRGGTLVGRSNVSKPTHASGAHVHMVSLCPTRHFPLPSAAPRRGHVPTRAPIHPHFDISASCHHPSPPRLRAGHMKLQNYPADDCGTFSSIYFFLFLSTKKLQWILILKIFTLILVFHGSFYMRWLFSSSSIVWSSKNIWCLEIIKIS